MSTPLASRNRRLTHRTSSAGTRRNEARDSADAKERLLKAALELFSQHGFDGTGVRALADAAGVNIAAVNYHFGSKENLRLEAFRYGFAPMLELRTETENYLSAARQAGSISAAEDALRKYIHRFLQEILATNSAHWSLLMREFTMPSPAFEMLIREYFEPQDAILVGILRLLLPDAPEMELHCCLGSIMGQCMHARNAAAIVRSTFGLDTNSEEYVRQRAKQIGDFSILALRGLHQGGLTLKTR